MRMPSRRRGSRQSAAIEPSSGAPVLHEGAGRVSEDDQRGDKVGGPDEVPAPAQYSIHATSSISGGAISSSRRSAAVRARTTITAVITSSKPAKLVNHGIRNSRETLDSVDCF